MGYGNLLGAANATATAKGNQAEDQAIRADRVMFHVGRAESNSGEPKRSSVDCTPIKGLALGRRAKQAVDTAESTAHSLHVGHATFPVEEELEDHQPKPTSYMKGRSFIRPFSALAHDLGPEPFHGLEGKQLLADIDLWTVTALAGPSRNHMTPESHWLDKVATKSTQRYKVRNCENKEGDNQEDRLEAPALRNQFRSISDRLMLEGRSCERRGCYNQDQEDVRRTRGHSADSPSRISSPKPSQLRPKPPEEARARPSTAGPVQTPRTRRREGERPQSSPGNTLHSMCGLIETLETQTPDDNVVETFSPRHPRLFVDNNGFPPTKMNAHYNDDFRLICPACKWDHSHRCSFCLLARTSTLPRLKLHDIGSRILSAQSKLSAKELLIKLERYARFTEYAQEIHNLLHLNGSKLRNTPICDMHKGEKDELENRVDQLEAKLSKSQAALAAAKEREAAVQDSYKSMNLCRDDYEERIERLTRLLAQADARERVLRETVVMMDEDTRVFRDQLSQLRTHHDSIAKEHKRYKRHNEALVVALEDVEESLRTLPKLRRKLALYEAKKLARPVVISTPAQTVQMPHVEVPQNFRNNDEEPILQRRAACPPKSDHGEQDRIPIGNVSAKIPAASSLLQSSCTFDNALDVSKTKSKNLAPEEAQLSLEKTLKHYPRMVPTLHSTEQEDGTNQVGRPSCENSPAVPAADIMAEICAIMGSKALAEFTIDPLTKAAQLLPELIKRQMQQTSRGCSYPIQLHAFVNSIRQHVETFPLSRVYVFAVIAGLIHEDTWSPHFADLAIALYLVFHPDRSTLHQWLNEKHQAINVPKHLLISALRDSPSYAPASILGMLSTQADLCRLIGQLKDDNDYLREETIDLDRGIAIILNHQIQCSRAILSQMTNHFESTCSKGQWTFEQFVDATGNFVSCPQGTVTFREAEEHEDKLHIHRAQCRSLHSTQHFVWAHLTSLAVAREDDQHNDIEQIEVDANVQEEMAKAGVDTTCGGFTLHAMQIAKVCHSFGFYPDLLGGRDIAKSRTKIAVVG